MIKVGKEKVNKERKRLVQRKEAMRAGRSEMGGKKQEIAKGTFHFFP